MSTRASIQLLRHRALGLQSPALSLYVPLTPGVGDAWRQVWNRARNATSKLPLPKPARDVVDQRLANPEVGGRTYVLYCDHEGTAIDSWLPIPMPRIEQSNQRVFARWGDIDIGPLLFAENTTVPTTVLWTDRDHYRLVEIDFGRALEDRRITRSPSPQENDRLQDSPQQHPAYTPDRGSAAEDHAQWHIEDLTRRFLRTAAAALESHIGSHASDVILMGSEKYTRALEDMLSEPVLSRVIASVHGPPSGDAPTSQVVERVEDLLRIRKEQRQKRLLEDASSRGVCGIDDVLVSLQEGRISTIVVPWPVPEVPVFRDTRTGYVSRLREDSRLSDAPSSPTELPTALTRLSEDYSADLAFVTGDDARTIEKDMGGMAGLLRY